MKKLFIQFYLLLFVCFLVMSLLVGLVYKFTAERAGKQSLDDLMNSSLYLMRSELREIPPHDWGKTLKEMDLNLSFDLRVEPLSKYHLDDISMHRLRGGEIVALDDQYTFFATYPAQPLRAGSWSCSLSLLPPSDAITGYRPDRFYCHFPRLSGVYLDASALAGYVKTGSSGATIWRWASQ
ncbi:two component sensor kinase [Escherichia coli]|uniref:Two component sensor kinase n=1 Tax=Escherichia coli TaxID=562 RepID=A0A377D4A6_ECOLX|nr:two component sensor kinase [Escherichia coli]